MIAQEQAEAVQFVGEFACPVAVPEHNGRAQADLSGNKECHACQQPQQTSVMVENVRASFFPCFITQATSILVCTSPHDG